MTVIVRLRGGLGNQLFQYAAGMSLAIHHGTDLKLDKSFLDTTKRPFWPYFLDRFDIHERFATKEEIAKIPGARDSVLATKFWAFVGRYDQSYYFYPTFVERSFSFDPNFFWTNKDVYLIGYWQSEKYFVSIADALRKEVTLKEPMPTASESMAEKIVQTESVSIHVRRGDYANHARTNRQHGLCSLDYYKRCVKSISERIHEPHFFVFSDEPDWVMKNLRTGAPTSFVIGNRAHEDLMLMSKCKHNIIANSSFSWWGAWLNPNKEKIVLAPGRWFAKPSIDTKDLLPESWTKVETELETD